MHSCFSESSVPEKQAPFYKYLSISVCIVLWVKAVTIREWSGHFASLRGDVAAAPGTGACGRAGRARGWAGAGADPRAGPALAPSGQRGRDARTPPGAGCPDGDSSAAESSSRGWRLVTAGGTATPSFRGTRAARGRAVVVTAAARGLSAKRPLHPRGRRVGRSPVRPPPRGLLARPCHLHALLSSRWHRPAAGGPAPVCPEACLSRAQLGLGSGSARAAQRRLSASARLQVPPSSVVRGLR